MTAVLSQLPSDIANEAIRVDHGPGGLFEGLPGSNDDVDYVKHIAAVSDLLLGCATPLDSLLGTPAPLPEPAPEPVQLSPRSAKQVKAWLPLIVTRPHPVPRPVLAGYTLLSPLCHGGFATVYHAQDLDTGEQCAVKLSTGALMTLQPDQDEEVLDCPEFQLQLHNTNWHYRCFAKECKTYEHLGCHTSSIIQLGLPRLFSSGLVLLPGRQVHSCLAVTLLGKSVYQELSAKRTLEPDCFARLAHGMLDALHHMHKHGYVHRDVKPGNFCVRPRNLQGPDSFVLDFGFAKPYRHSANSWNKMPNEAFEGTPDYASLASLRSARQGPRDDLESLCYSMLEMLHGHLPWDVTNLAQWPPAARARMAKRGGVSAADDAQEELDWNEHNLAIMADLRQINNARYIKSGFIPGPMSEWLEHVQELQPWELPEYTYLHRLIDRTAAWQHNRWPQLANTLRKNGFAVPQPDDMLATASLLQGLGGARISEAQEEVGEVDLDEEGWPASLTPSDSAAMVSGCASWVHDSAGRSRLQQGSEPSRGQTQEGSEVIMYSCDDVMAHLGMDVTVPALLEYSQPNLKRPASGGKQDKKRARLDPARAAEE
ncbi:kinase-like domain-containing protein [Haematococcus lacustris]